MSSRSTPCSSKDGGSTAKRRLIAACALVAGLTMLARTSWAEPLEANHTYAGGTRVEAPSVGVSLVVPEGWVGRFGQNARAQVLFLGSNTIEGVGIVLFQSGTTAAQVVATLNEPQDLGGGVILRPTAPAKTQDSRIDASYRNQTYIGRALALLGPTRNAVVLFFAGPPKHDGTYAQLLETLSTSTTFVPAAAVAAQPPSPTATGVPPPWAGVLTDQALNYFSSYNSGGGGGGMAAHRVLHLCANGQFTLSGDSMVTMNVPGASGSSGGRSGFHGRWTVESATDRSAVLVLAGDDGRELRWPLRWDGSKTFLNGQRWLRERSRLCR